MKCLLCGSDNLDSAKICSKCGGALQKEKEQLDTNRQSLEEFYSSDGLKQLSRDLQEMLTPLIRDPGERVLAQIEKLMFKGTDPNESIDSFLMNVGTLIYRLFGISEVAIALKDRANNLFKYRLFFGMRKESEDAYRRITYTLEQVTSTSKYPRIKLSDYTEFFPSEYRPYLDDELDTYNRPSKLKMERKSPNEMIEGDYFCVYFYGISRNDVLGWFELARTRDGKMPTRETFKWLELIASIVGRIIHERGLSKRLTVMQRL